MCERMWDNVKSSGMADSLYNATTPKVAKPPIEIKCYNQSLHAQSMGFNP